MSGTFKVRFVGYHQSSKRWSSLALQAALVTGLMFGSVVARAGPSRSFVYCLDQGGAKVFAGRAGDASLAFGLSVWSPSGQNISLFGIALPHGGGWQYTDNLKAATIAERCRLDILRGADGTLRVTADPSATCQSHGGVNAEIGTLEFPRTAYEGPVTTELDDPESFQKAGKCVARRS